MASYTPNYHLKKPATTDYVLVSDINDNMDTIDGALEIVLDKASDIVAVQDAQPSSQHNKIWIKETPESEVTVPTYDEFVVLKEAYNKVYTYSEPIDFSTAESRNGLISSSNVWSTTTGFKSYKFDFIDEMYSELTVTASSTSDAVIGLLKNGTLSQGDPPNFCTGITGRIVVTAGETLTVPIPTDCTYIVISKTGSSSKDLTPSAANFTLYKTIPDVDATLSVSNDAADAKVTGDKIKEVFDAVTETENIDLESAPTRKGLINSSNVWSTTTGFLSYKFSIGSEYFKLIVEAGENGTTVGLLKNSQLVNSETPPFCDGITGRIPVAAEATAEIPIPSDCTYIVIMKESNSADYTPEAISFVKWAVGGSIEQNPLGLHEKAPSESALNIVKRCRQMTDIKWTPAVDLPRYMLVQRGLDIPESAESEHYLGTFKAGTEYTGIPYGRVSSTMPGYDIDYATAGHYIDLETFVTSVSNPKSKLCVDDVGSVFYHRSVIYASVCSGLVCHALDVPEVPTANIPSISGLSLIGKVNNDGTLLADSNFRIGDIINAQDTHAAVITDIIRDNEGKVQFVELSEATTKGCADRNYGDGQTGGLCRRKGWTREQLFDPRLWGKFSLYRYTKNVPYTPSPFVNVGDEFDMDRIERLPCMPYEGNKFTYKTVPNDTVKIVITLSGYAYLKVFKGDTEITGSPFTVSSDSVDITEVSSGSYTAYLCNISEGNVTNLTYPCSWTIE